MRAMQKLFPKDLKISRAEKLIEWCGRLLLISRFLGQKCLDGLTKSVKFCSLGGPGALMTTGVALLYTSAGLAVWSLVVYMRKIWKVLLR